MPYDRPMTSLRGRVSSARQSLLGIRAVNENPYATHLPVLLALGQALPVRRVLELGAGSHSTPAFANPSYFPELTSLVSLEDDSEWFETLSALPGLGGPNVELRLVDAVRHSVPSDLSMFDLVFIDDSQVLAERAQTIRSVALTKPTGVVAVHDYEQRAYRAATRWPHFKHRFIFKTFTPQVGVLWNGADVDVRLLESAAATLEEHRRLGVADLDSWKRVLTTGVDSHP
jgi:predicted O-methyltransferase YrrM